MSMLWGRLRNGSKEKRRTSELSRVTGDVFSDSELHNEDLEPEFRAAANSWSAPAAAALAPVPEPASTPKLSESYVASSGEAALERKALRNDAEFGRLLAAEVVDLEALRSLSWNGVPGPRRSVVWRLLLGHLPLARAEREATLKEKRSEFERNVSEALLDVPASARSVEDQQTLRQILVDARATDGSCHGTSPRVGRDHVCQNTQSSEERP